MIDPIQHIGIAGLVDFSRSIDVTGLPDWAWTSISADSDGSLQEVQVETNHRPRSNTSTTASGGTASPGTASSGTAATPTPHSDIKTVTYSLGYGLHLIDVLLRLVGQ